VSPRLTPKSRVGDNGDNDHESVPEWDYEWVPEWNYEWVPEWDYKLDCESVPE